VLRGLLLLPVLALVAGCGGSGSAAPAVRRPSQAPRTAGPRWPKKPAAARFLRVHARDRSVDLTLIADDGAGNNGFNFDGYGRGELLVRVPVGWRVNVHCKNAAPQPVSCAVVSDSLATTPAFRGASVPAPVTGIAGGASATFSFVASRAGVYRLASLVPGQEEARMWDVLEVTRGGAPAISGRPGP
jgi:hypothetical protein